MNLLRSALRALAFAVTTVSLAHAAGNSYEQHNLVSDGNIAADHTDAHLVNAWGLAFGPTSPAWVADNNSGVSTLYDGLGNAQPPAPLKQLVVAIPSPTDDTGGGTPTGVVFNPTNGFVVTKGKGGPSGASIFIFATEDGVIAGWSPAADGTHAIRAVTSPDTVYKGLAIAPNRSGEATFLYATDFHNGKIDVFDARFQPVTLPQGAFSDRTIPAGFAPFNIQNIQGNLYVTYAKQNAARHDDVKGAGFGFVNVFDGDGNLIHRVATRGRLNAPWGVALAPAGFGKFANQLLVGNFGDGAILAFDAHSHEFLGRLRKADGSLLQIDGLWALMFGNGAHDQPTSTLFFTAGPAEETQGLFGTITPASGGRDDDRDDD
jgi:uncharacterized protein (TIGR03118 family)